MIEYSVLDAGSLMDSVEVRYKLDSTETISTTIYPLQLPTVA